MIVNRRVFNIKVGQQKKAVEIIKQFHKTFPHPHLRRIYTVEIGTTARVITEDDYESLAKYEEFWAEVRASQDYRDFAKEFLAISAGGTVSEIYNLE